MSNSDFLKKVSAFIAKHQMLQKEGTYLVALSGGADSVALLCAMQALGYRVKAAHCNFHLRGEESLRDAQFCKQLCKEKGIFMHQTNFDTRAHAAKRKISIEMAARQLRYTYFYKMFWKYGYAGVCIAHHRDDSVETLLINLIRGTGIHGLRGITPVNEIFYRPLLGVSRVEIEDYLSSIGQDYITDSSNLVDDVVRNKIRLNVLPLLETINPSVRKCIAKTAGRMRDAASIIDRVMEERTGDFDLFSTHRPIFISIALIKNEEHLYLLLEDYGFKPQQIEQIYDNLHATTGKMFRSDTHELLFDRGNIIVERRGWENIPLLTITATGTFSYSDGKTFTVAEEEYTPGMLLDRGPHCALLDKAKVAFPLTVRRAAKGDRFVPLGMTGSKLLSDFMTDRKMTRFEKRAQLVVTDATGRIVWLVNHRPDHRFAVTGETRSLISIKLIIDN